MKQESHEVMYHIGLCKDDLKGAEYAIIPGDPGRVEKIARMLDNPVFLKSNREYTSWLGYVNNKPVVVCSTGIGGPSASICVQELFNLGVTNFIRVGTCGGMNLDVKAGDVVVVTGSIRMEGTSKEYLPIEFPAVADFDITKALIDSCQQLDLPYHKGVIQCKDSFYGQHSPQTMPVGYELEQKWQAWIKGGCLASEMESAALFIVASSLGIRAGAVMLTVWNQERENAGLDQQVVHDTTKAISVAVQALKNII